MTAPLYTAPPGHFSLLMAAGRTATYSTPETSPASFCLYVPTSHPISRRAAGQDTDGQGTRPYPLVVLVHGSRRNHESLRDTWAELAEKHDIVLLCPLFPTDLPFPAGSSNYKQIIYHAPHGDVRYDLLLCSIIETVAKEWGFVQSDRFSLVGFSGGAQFAHRFWYLHPERIRAISIGAPGSTTLLENESWPQGIGNTGDKFDTVVDPSRLNAPAQLMVGSNDFVRGVNDSGVKGELSRVQVLRDFSANLTAHGVKHEVYVKEGIGHQSKMMANVAQAFVLKHLNDTL